MDARHAKLFRSASGNWRILNLQSRNGIWLKMKRITVGVGCSFAFEIGNQRLRLRFGREQLLPSKSRGPNAKDQSIAVQVCVHIAVHQQRKMPNVSRAAKLQPPGKGNWESSSSSNTADSATDLASDQASCSWLI